VEIREVNSSKDKKEFLLLPVRIYKEDPNWIRPLDSDIEKIFDPKQNKLFRKGEATRFLALEEKKILGRIAVFLDPQTSKKEKQPTGGIGFFECIDDQEIAFKLFDTCKKWLEERGMEAMDGPINFGERNNWWGLLVDDFSPPNYCSNYNPPYYKKFFENYGFQVYFNQYTYYRKVSDELSDKVKAKAERIFSNPDFTFDHFRKNRLEKYADDFLTIYNLAWVKHGTNKLKRAQAILVFKQMKPVIDEDIVLFAYHKGNPAAFFIMLPELNQLFKYVNGKLDLWGKMKFLYHKLTGSCTKMFGLVFGVVPEHQGKGLEGAIVRYSSRIVQGKNKKVNYEDFEMNWIGDFNPKMMKLCEEVGGRISKTHHTYRLLFDITKPFERHPLID
jgi:hypothetical protein